MAQHFRGNLRILGEISSPNSFEINTDHTVATSVELIHTFVACYHIVMTFIILMNET